MWRAITMLILAMAIGLGNACICSAASAPAPTHCRSCCNHSPKPASPAHHCSHCDGTAPAIQVATAKTTVQLPTISPLLLTPLAFVLPQSQSAAPTCFSYAGLPPPLIDRTLLELACALNA